MAYARMSLDTACTRFFVTFGQPGPLPQVDTLIGHALGAKAVQADAGLDVGEPSAGRQADEQHPALVVEAESMGLDRSLVLNQPDMGGSPRICERRGETCYLKVQ